MGNFCIWEASAFFWVYTLFLMCQGFIVGVKGLNKVSQKKFSSLVWCKISGTYRILPSCWSWLWTLLCWHRWHSLCSATWLIVKARSTLSLWALYNLYIHIHYRTHICPSVFPLPALPFFAELHGPSRTANSLKRGKHIQSWRGPTSVSTSLTPRKGRTELWPCIRVSAISLICF